VAAAVEVEKMGRVLVQVDALVAGHMIIIITIINKSNYKGLTSFEDQSF
jgi:hypothetical protein